MRVLFWQRKNKKLETRLTNVVETSERARASYRPKKRRVTIDTSYLQQSSEPQPAEAEYDEEQFEEDEFQGPHATGDAADQETGTPEPLDEAHSDDEVDTADWDEESFSVLEEALRQLDDAEARSDEAEKALEAERARATELEAAMAREQSAREAAEARLGEATAALEDLRKVTAPPVATAELDGRLAALQRDLEDQQALTGRVEGELVRAQSAKRDLETERNEARKRAEEAEKSLAELRQAATRTDDTGLGNTDETTELKAHLKALKNEIECERRARREADVQREKANIGLEDARSREQSAIRKAEEAAAQAEDRARAAEAREARIQTLERELAEATAARD
ncbi:MAG: hypothetical protein RLZ98_2737, partial [Pseudomonadota bacterium]